MLPAKEIEAGLRRLDADIRSGAWNDSHRNLLDARELDLGYRIVVTERRGGDD